MLKKLDYNTRNLPTHWYLTFILFVGLFALQQIIVLAFNFGFSINPIVGLIAGAILIVLTINLLLQFKIVNQPIPTSQIKIKGNFISLIILAVITTYVLQITWALTAETTLHLNLNGSSSGNQTAIMTYFHHGLIPAIFMITLTVLVAPAIEEFIFRVLIIKPDHKHKYKWYRIVGSLVLFALAHVITQVNKIPWNNWCFYFGQYFLIGFCLTFIYCRYRNYRINYLTHMTWNLLSLAIALI